MQLKNTENKINNKLRTKKSNFEKSKHQQRLYCFDKNGNPLLWKLFIFDRNQHNKPSVYICRILHVDGLSFIIETNESKYIFSKNVKFSAKCLGIDREVNAL